MDKIEHRKTDDLQEYGSNPRKNDHAVEQVAAAIREFGFRVPVLIRSDGTVIDGHLRLKAARHLGMDTVPCLVADDMTDAQVKAFRISVNKVAELADWDYDLLKEELLEIADHDDVDISSLPGFSAEEVESLLDDIGIIDDPDATGSLSGGHSVNKSVSVWIYDCKLTTGSDAAHDWITEHIDDVRRLDHTAAITAMLEALDGLLD